MSCTLCWWRSSEHHWTSLGHWQWRCFSWVLRNGASPWTEGCRALPMKQTQCLLGSHLNKDNCAECHTERQLQTSPGASGSGAAGVHAVERVRGAGKSCRQPAQNQLVRTEAVTGKWSSWTSQWLSPASFSYMLCPSPDAPKGERCRPVGLARHLAVKLFQETSPCTYNLRLLKQLRAFLHYCINLTLCLT